ncbi:MAG: hypothetical protein ACT4PI_16785 [Actinomycetota bacterium]
MSAPGTSVRDRVGLLVTAFVVSLGMVAGIATAVTGGDEPERALPETRDPVPVIAPVATGPTPPAEPDPATADGSGGGSGGGGGGGGTPSPDVSESAATDGDGSGGSDAPGTAGGDGESGGSGDGGADEALPDYGLRFYDECAGTEPGAPLPEGCPEPSVGGTVLALTDPYPQYVLFAPHAGGTGWATRCPSGPLAEGELPSVAVTINPGTLRLEYWPRAEGTAGWSFPDDPSVITTIDRTTASESDPEHRLWAGWFEDGTLNSDYEHRLQYCLTLSDLREGQTYQFRVSSTDIFGSSATWTGSFGLYAPATPRDRPPVTITPVDDTRVAVRVPIRSGINEHAIVHAVPRSGPDAGTCADMEAGGLDAFGPPRGTRAATETTTDISDDELDAEGYPWAPVYDEVYEKQLSLDEGTTSAVCIWWQTGPRRSFDPSRITEREEHLVTTPNRYRFRATIERLTFTRPVGADGVAIDILRPGGGRLCTAQVPAEEVTLGDVEEVVVEPHDVFCDLTGNGDTAAIGDALDVRVTGPVGEQVTSRIDVSARPCGPDGAVRVCTPEHTDWYRLNIPGEVASRTLCGGVGDVSCEPTRHRSAGLALVRVDLVDGPDAGGRDDYDFSAPAPFTGDDTVPEPPPYPQLDDFTSGVEPSDRDSLTVTANLDRPATVRAFVYAEPGDPTPCLLPGATGSVTSATMSPSHFLVFDGLCAAHLYSVALEMTDAEGDVAYAALSGWAVPRPVQRWNGWGTVRGFDANVDVYMQILDLPGHGYGYLTRAEVSFDGNEFSWPEPVGGCFARGDRRGSSFARTDDGVAWTFSNQVEIVVDVEAVEAFNWDDRDPLRPRCERRRNSGRTRLQATVPAEELLRGTPVTLTSPAGDLLEVEVEVVVTPRGA